MTILQLKESRRNPRGPEIYPVAPVEPQPIEEIMRTAGPLAGHPVDRVPAEIRQWRAELDAYYVKMREFPAMHPDEIFQYLAAWYARAGEIRLDLVRMQTRFATALRTQEIDPFTKTLDDLFKCYSRIVTIAEQDLKLAGKTP